MTTKTKRMLIVFLTVVLLGATVGYILSACPTTIQYPIEFEKAETALFEALHLDKVQVLKNTVMAQARAEGDLEDSMSMKLYAIVLHDYVPNKHLSFTANHIYNIGAKGGEFIRFDLVSLPPNLTEITVNYTDKWVGVWPPFVFFDAGLRREKRIHEIIWQKLSPRAM